MHLRDPFRDDEASRQSIGCYGVSQHIAMKSLGLLWELSSILLGQVALAKCACPSTKPFPPHCPAYGSVCLPEAFRAYEIQLSSHLDLNNLATLESGNFSVTD